MASKKITNDHLVICTGIPILKTIPDPADCLFVLSNAEVLLRGELEQYPCVSLEDFLDPQDYDQVRHDLAEEWDVILQRYNSHTLLANYFFNFSNCRTATLFWSRQLKRLFDWYKPKTIWLSKKILDKEPILLGDDGDSFRKFLAWAFQELLINASELQGCDIKYYEESFNTTKDISNDKNLRNEIIENFISRLICVIDKASHLTAKVLGNHLPSDKPILIVAQISKIHRLIDCLVKNKKPYRVFTYNQARNMLFTIAGCPDAQFSFSINPFYDSSISLTLENWLCSLSRFHETITDNAIASFLDKFNSPIITDGEHDPIVARINQFIAKEQSRKIFTIPEGGLNFFSFAKSERYHLPDHNNLVRFLSSPFDLQLCLKQENSHQCAKVCGYGTSLRYSRFYGDILRLFLRLFKARGKRIIFYDHAPFDKEYIGIYRTNARPEKLMHSEVRSITDVFDRSLYHVITSNRGMISKFKHSCQGSVSITRLHWSVLAWCADVVISRESTILLECLKLGRPVVFCDPYPDYPAVYEYLKKVTSNGYRFVSDPGLVVHAVEQLMTEPPNQSLFDYYMSDPHYAEMISCMK
jgi:hypothetical protein